MNEPLDRNKTTMTHNVTSLAMIYLENRGFKPIETEVCIDGYGIADVASFVYPTPTEVKKLRLANQKRFGLTDTSCYQEISFRYGPMLTAVVEVKTSRADFLKDKDKFKLHPAHLCYLAYQKGILDKNELPLGWLGLEVNSTGTGLLRRHWNHPTVHPQHPGVIAEFLASLAIRADNRVRYSRNRLIMKMYRANS